ncbi:glucan biosynthesis protein [Alloalcanivorax mobilis]|uniref:glucan biosynthesis protein n=1 Tax=Alloalcanivorax mobilis TaxID=2019569 RepID=UPI000B5B48EA|nr:glucan biosynthesis protein D [Alloalcanivorax mobilis]ASK35565.1 glucan biosynthesis protein D [Alcanivorax sp. N3-2A]|tara:strand:+ start:9723 stop:11348 length:1626 start_codon:yes stop_codon:yes gene_type:complete
MRRRDFLRALARASGGMLAFSPTLALALNQAARASRLTPRGPGQRFDYAWLKGEARHLCGQDYRSPRMALPESIRDLTWDQYQAIRYDSDQALWADDPDTPFRLQFFHLGLHFTTPVKMFEVSDGVARPIPYRPRLFRFDGAGVDAGRLPDGLGFAGFRLHPRGDWQRDIAAFLGASYFRAVGASKQYGLSARGLAVDTGLPRPEEFPEFTRFWFEHPLQSEPRLTLHALLDSPSVTGAYRFVIDGRGETLRMDVDSALYPRTAIERLGVAPLTSMYLVGENDRDAGWDWRPEIHDCDGLALHTGNGEWIWRPLSNPPRLRVNAFADDNPRGFGLLQRDQNFDHYQDDGAFYDRRPGVWVEPRSGWGRGAVQLVEIPTRDETFDNVVAFWNPEKPVRPGEELLFAYRLHWGARPPQSPPLARCVATRTGLGGVIGQRRDHFSWRFAVDFSGAPLPLNKAGVEVVPVISHSAGRVEITSARPLHAINGYRALFDVVPPDDDLTPIDLRLYLKRTDTGAPLTETWIYQWSPPPMDQRALHNPD